MSQGETVFNNARHNDGIAALPSLRSRALYFREAMSKENGDYRISDDRSDVQLDKVEALLRSSYWAKERPLETMMVSIENSICFSLLHKGEQLGFARVVTDFASVAYIADLIIHPDHRGRGLGKWMFGEITNDPRWSAKFQFLATDDAHGLYEQFGFSGSSKLMSTKI